MNHCYSIAFYNLENLFDPEDGDHTLDRNYTPEGIYAWDRARYMRKIDNLGLSISRIGRTESDGPPVFLGVCEVENERCLKDLVQCDSLRDHGYDFVHFESPDRRGLDTAFLYQKDQFRLLGSKPFSVVVNGKSGEENTRDILYIEGVLLTEHLHILVNHWPSRLDGSRSTQSKRRELALEMKRIVDAIYRRDPLSKIIIIGDFNDEPDDYSLKEDFSHDFLNTLIHRKMAIGTARHKKKWVLFDQILLNKNLLNSEKLTYRASHVFHPPFLIQSKGRFKGNPKRTFLGRYHQGGYSDHFPVYALFDSHQ